jgi:hypothetical protein
MPIRPQLYAKSIIQPFTTQLLGFTKLSIIATVLNSFNIMPLGNRDPKTICVAGSINSKIALVLSDQLKKPLGQCVFAGKTVRPPLVDVSNTVVRRLGH